MTSVSESFRIKGNELYARYQKSTNLQDQFFYLQKAINLYYLAVEKSNKENKDEMVSAFKNYAMANWKIAIISDIIQKPKYLVEYYFKDALKHFSKAVAYSTNVKNKAWISQLGTSYSICVDNMIEFIDKYESAAAIRILETNLFELVEDSEIKSILLKLAKLYNINGVAALVEKNFKEALSNFNESNQTAERCHKIAVESKDEYYTSEANVLTKENVYNIEIAEALQALYLGDQSLQMALTNDDILNMNLVYDAIDWYKKAVINTRQLELEIEAMALSKLGCLYAEVLKTKSKAKEYLNFCLQIATHVKGVNNEVWFKKTQRILQEYQKDVIDEEKVREETERYLVELQPVINKLNQANVGTGPSAFLNYLYKEHPPKCDSEKINLENLVGCSKANMRKILLTALLNYHPDKQAEFNDKKWIVLCNEITKMLNSHYENNKNFNE